MPVSTCSSIQLSNQVTTECMCSCNTSKDSSFLSRIKTGVIEAVQDGTKLNSVHWNNTCGFQCTSERCKVKSRKCKILIRLKEKQKGISLYIFCTWDEKIQKTDAVFCIYLYISVSKAGATSISNSDLNLTKTLKNRSKIWPMVIITALWRIQNTATAFLWRNVTVLTKN